MRFCFLKAGLIPVLAVFLLASLVFAQTNTAPQNDFGLGSNAQSGGSDFGPLPFTGNNGQNNTTAAGPQNGFGGGSGFDFRLGIGNDFEDGLSAQTYVRSLMMAGLLKGLAFYRQDIQKNCLTESGEQQNIDLLTKYYQANSTLATKICQNRKEESANCSTDICGNGFKNFMKFLPADVRSAAAKAGLTEADFDFSNASSSQIKGTIVKICQAKAAEEMDKQKARMTKEADKMVEQFNKMCEMQKQRQQQEEQQQQQWQNQQQQYQQNRVPPAGNPGPCPPDMFFDQGTNGCKPMDQGGQQPPQEPPAGGDTGTGSGSGSGGGLLPPVLNQMFGKTLFPITGFATMLQLQDSGAPPQGSPPQGSYPTSNYPSGTYPSSGGYPGGYPNGGYPNYSSGPNGQYGPTGMNEPYGPNGQYGDPSQRYGGPMGPNGSTANGGYDAGPMGGPGFGMSGQGGGFGGPFSPDDCESGTDIRQKVEEQMGGVDFSSEIDSMCNREAERHAEEISQMMEKQAVQKEFCEAEQANRCAFKKEVANACDAAIQDGIPKLAGEIVQFQCQVVKLKASREQAGRFSGAALKLLDATSSLGGSAEVAGTSAAQEIFDQEKQVKETQQKAGVLSLITGSAELKQKYENTLESLQAKQKLIDGLGKEQLTTEEQQKVAEAKTELQNRIEEAKKCADSSASLFGRILSGC